MENNQQSQIPRLLPEDIKDKRKVIVVLERAGLSVTRVGKQQVILNSDEHSHYIQNVLHGSPTDYRPDITHQCLLTLLDSPLNKAGLLKILINTREKQIIEVHPQTKIPRTYSKFAPLMVYLLKKLRIRAQQTSQTLLRVLKNPLINHLPTNCLKVGTSTKARLITMEQYADEIPQNEPIVFVVGAVAKGNPGMEVDYTNDAICFSKYPLSAAYAIQKILYAFEKKWAVV